MLLEEFLKPLGLTQQTLADELGVSLQRLNGIINGKRALTADTAVVLGKRFNMSPQFWLALQSNLDLWHAERRFAAGEPAKYTPPSHRAIRPAQKRVVPRRVTQSVSHVVPKGRPKPKSKAVA